MTPKTHSLHNLGTLREVEVLFQGLSSSGPLPRPPRRKGEQMKLNSCVCVEVIEGEAGRGRVVASVRQRIAKLLAPVEQEQAQAA